MNRCMKGGKNKWVFDWPNLSVYMASEGWHKPYMREGFTLEDVAFQLQQQRGLAPRCRLHTMPNLPISRLHFRAPTNTHAHPTTHFPKAIRRNTATPLSEHTNEWNNGLHMDGYYVFLISTQVVFFRPG